MHVFDQVRLIVYRYHEKGLEVFLVNTGFEEEHWRIPFEEIAKYADNDEDDRVIALESVKDNDGKTVRTIAIEGDWHDIPSIRKLIAGDITLVASKMKYLVDKGAFFAFKEAFKKVLPNEYEALHELKDILTSRNILSNI